MSRLQRVNTQSLDPTHSRATRCGKHVQYVSTPYGVTRGVHVLRGQGHSLELVRARTATVLIRERSAFRLSGCIARLRCLCGGVSASGCGL